MPSGEWEPSPRDILIDRVRRGQMTPQQAEAEAARQGFGPMATKPDRIDFDPAKMPWWTLPMALAWIAWRSAELVRESCAEYREHWLEWFPGSWNVPSEDGSGFDLIHGYELKSVRGSTVVRLTFEETYMRSTDGVPSTTEMTIGEAENELFRALAAGKLTAAAKDKHGNVVDVPQREWPYLQCFEEQDQDVLKHDALEAPAAFTEIKLKREDIQNIWPEFVVEPHMIAPMMSAGTAGFVPLCCAIHWIMTEGGRVARQMKDREVWQESANRLLKLISTGEVEVIGRSRGGGPAETIKGHIFAGILVPGPLEVSFSALTGDDPWISCSPYIDETHWLNDFNDQVFIDRLGAPAWTLVSFGYKRCAGDLEAFKGWSQNLGHNQMLTTLSSYGNITPERQAEILNRQRAATNDQNFSEDGEPDANTIKTVLAHLAQAVSRMG